MWSTNGEWLEFQKSQILNFNFHSHANSWASNTCFVIMTSLGKLNDKIIKMILGKYVKIHTRTILIAYKCDKGVYGGTYVTLVCKIRMSYLNE
jgi:hypothetical protein